VILGNSEVSQDRVSSLPGVVQDLANLKRFFLSESIGFAESNILTLFNLEKQEIIKSLEERIQADTLENIILYYSGFGATTHDNEFYITCCNSDFNDMATCISAHDIGSIFEKNNSSLILIFDCCYAQRVFKYLYNKDVFLFGAASETEYATETSDGGLFTKNLLNVLHHGIDNNKDHLSLCDIYLEVRKNLIDVQEPEMLTTNIVQHLLLSKNPFQVSQQKIQDGLKQKSKDQIRELITENMLEEAFEQLNIVLQDKDEHLKNQLMLFENRYSRVRDEILLRIIKTDDSNIEINQIVYGLIKLLNEI
jgi:hypothetical protein